MIQKLFAIVLLFNALSAYALDTQFTCTFGSEVKVASNVINQPSPIVGKAEKIRYKFFVESLNPLKVSYIRIGSSLETKSPIHAMKNGHSYIFVESNTSSNHFLVSIFTEHKVSDGYIAVMSFHNGEQTSSDDYYAQSIKVGRCI